MSNAADSAQTEIVKKKTGILWKRRFAEREISLVDERGCRTYSALAEVLTYLRVNKICDGTFVEASFSKGNVISELKAVIFEGKVQKWADKYAFLSAPILPQIKLSSKGDRFRVVADCRILRNPPASLSNVWFNPQNCTFDVSHDTRVLFSVCVTLKKIKRTKNPPYLDVHAVKIRLPNGENHEEATPTEEISDSMKGWLASRMTPKGSANGDNDSSPSTFSLDAEEGNRFKRSDSGGSPSATGIKKKLSRSSSAPDLKATSTIRKPRAPLTPVKFKGRPRFYRGKDPAAKESPTIEKHPRGFFEREVNNSFDREIHPFLDSLGRSHSLSDLHGNHGSNAIWASRSMGHQKTKRPQKSTEEMLSELSLKSSSISPRMSHVNPRGRGSNFDFLWGGRPEFDSSFEKNGCLAASPSTKAMRRGFPSMPNMKQKQWKPQNGMGGLVMGSSGLKNGVHDRIMESFLVPGSHQEEQLRDSTEFFLPSLRPFGTVKSAPHLGTLEDIRFQNMGVYHGLDKYEPMYTNPPKSTHFF